MAGTVRRERRGSSVARQVFALQLLIVLVLIVVATVLAYVDARASQLDDARRRSVDIALSVADSPAVDSALRTPEPAFQVRTWPVGSSMNSA